MATIEGASSSTFPVFVDTNLETHLLIIVSSDDTVDDLKGKITTEHLVSFPNVGEISVQAMKVKRRGFFYSLSNSMVVEKAFEGIKGARFLHIDLVPATSIVKSQTGLAKVIMNESDVQPDKHNLVQTGHDANQLAVNGEDRHRDSIVNGMAMENGPIRTSVSSVSERETLQGLDKRLDREVPEMEKLVIEGNAAVGSDLQQKSQQVADQEKKDGMGEDHEKASAGAGMGVPIASKKEKSRKRHDALEIDQLPNGTPEHPYMEKKKHKKEKGGSFKELVKKTVMPENNLQKKQDNNLASYEGFSSKPSHVDSSLQASVNSKQNRKNKKHMLKNDKTPQNEMVDSSLNMIDDATLEKQGAKEIHVDELVKNHMEVGKESDVADLFGSTQEVLADGKSEHPSVENKKSKEENDGSSKDLVTELPENSFQEKQEINLVSEGSSLPPPVDAKQKRKRKKHLSKNNEAPQTQLVDSSLVKTDEGTQGKQAAGVDHAEELVKNHIDLRKESDAADLMEESTEKVLQTFLPENCFLEKRGTNLASSVNSKQNRKKKKHILKNDETPQIEMVDSSLNMTDDATLEKQGAKEIHVDESVKNHMEVGKESDVADLFGSTQEVLADGKSEHPSVENKKSKEENDGSSKDLVTDLPENSFQEKQEINLVSEGSSLPPPVDAKQKRKRKKHLSKNNEAPQTQLVDSSLVKTDEGTQGKQAAGVDHAEELVKNHIDLRKESDAADLMEESTEKVLQTFLPENCFLEKRGTNLVSSDGIPSKLSNVDSSLRASVDAKKRKKKKHLSKSDEAPENDIDISLDKDNNASLRKQHFEENHVEELVNHHAELGKESDAADPIKESTPKEQDGHSAKLRTTDPLSANPNESTDTRKRSTKFPVEDENFYKVSGNNQAQLSKVSDVVMTDAHLADKNAVESAIPSEIGTKSSHRRKRKKREKTELPNAQSNTNETVNSPGGQGPEEIQNKISSTHQEQLVGSTVLSSPNEKKKIRSQEKLEKIELHHQESNIQSGTQEEVDSSVDQIIGKVTKEMSIKHIEAASLQEAAENSTAVQSIVPSTPNDKKSKLSQKKSAENSTAVQFIVLSNPNDKKSKRSRKKSDRVELHSGDPNSAEPVHSFVENPEVSFKDTQNKTLGSGPACPSKDSALAAIDSTVPPNPSDKKSKRSRKKPEKEELLAEEHSKDEGVHPLEKEATKEKSGNALNDISTRMDTNSKSATIRREDAGLESLTESTSAINSTANGRNSSRNYDLDHSLTNEGTNENLEKISGTTNKSSGIELTARINLDETGWSMDDANTSNLVPTGYDDPFGNHETVCLPREKENIIGLEKAGEGSMEIVHDRVHNASAEAKDHRQPAKCNSTNIDIKFSNPNLNQPEDVQGLPFAETETSNSNKEKAKRKKKLDLSPQDSTINLLKTSVSEQHVLKKKPQDSDLGEHGLVAPEVRNSKELKSRKKHEKRYANSIKKSDRHLYDTSSGLETHVDDKIDGKLKNHELSTHSQGSLTVDKKGKYPSGKNSMITGNKLQSFTREDTDIVVSATEVSKQKIDDASVKSSTGGAAVANNSSNAVDSIPTKELVAGLAASSDSTEEDAQIQKKRYRVVVRKVPSKRYKNVSDKFNEEKTLVASSATIFNDASSGSSEDEFEISNRQASVRANLDNSSTSADSDGDLDGTQTAYKNSPAGSGSVYGKVDRRTNDALSSLTKTSNAKRRGKPLSSILKSSSSYKKAKLAASQSEFQDSESQPFDVIPETQAE